VLWRTFRAERDEITREKEHGTHCVRSRHALGPGEPVAIGYGGAAVDGGQLAITLCPPRIPAGWNVARTLNFDREKPATVHSQLGTVFAEG
jgi:hypothetical protein